VQVDYKINTYKTDTAKSYTSFLPNLAHSIDAYTVFIANSFSLLHPSMNLKTIHDAFITTKEHEQLIKSLYASSLYSKRYFLSNSIKENVHKIKK
jgi:hypothetical protein